MKKLLLSLTLVLSTSAFAETIGFSCISEVSPGVHKFDAHGVVTVDDNNNVEGIATIVTEKAGATHSAQTFDDTHVTGYIRHFRAGEVTTKAFDQLVLKTDATYLRRLNLLLGIDEKIASRALSIDNFSYRSNCKITERFN